MSSYKNFIKIMTYLFLFRKNPKKTTDLIDGDFGYLAFFVTAAK